MRHIAGYFIRAIGGALGIASLLGVLNTRYGWRLGLQFSPGNPIEVPAGQELSIMLALSAFVFLGLGQALLSDALADFARENPQLSGAILIASTIIFGSLGRLGYIEAIGGPGMHAVEQNDTQALREFLEREPPAPEFLNDMLHRALLHHSSDVVALLAKRADLHWQRGESASYHLEDACHWADQASISHLLQAGAPIDSQNAHNHTPLMTVILYREGSEAEKLPLVELLLEHGARLDLKNFQGLTPSELARSMGYESMARLLESRASKESYAAQASFL